MSYELLGAAKMLADELGSKVVRLRYRREHRRDRERGRPTTARAKVYAVDGASFKTFRPDAFAKAAASLISKYKPDIVLFRSTTQGSGLSSAAAALLEVGLGVGRHRPGDRRRHPRR